MDLKRFSVVQFITLPFENIDKYVCVPDAWLVVPGRKQDQKVVVAYPKNEDRYVTRNRVKKEEKYCKDWKFWRAEVKYQTDTFEDADLWIAKKNYYGPSVQQNSILSDMPSTSSTLKLGSSKLKSTSKLDKHTTEMAKKPFEIARKPFPKTTIKRPVRDHSQPKLENKRFKQPISKDAEQTGAVCQSGNEDPGCSSMPATTENGPAEVINATEDNHSQQVRQSRENNDNSKSKLVIDVEAAQNNLQDNGNSNFQPPITNVQSLATTSNNQKHCANNSYDNGPSTSGHQVESKATQLYEKMKGKPSLVATHPGVERKMCFENVLLKNPPNSMNQNHPPQDPRILSTNRSNQFVNSGSRPTSSQEIQHVARINIERTHNSFQNPRVVLQNMAGVVSAPQVGWEVPSSSEPRFNFAHQLNGHKNSLASDQRMQQNTHRPQNGLNAADRMRESLIRQRRYLPTRDFRRPVTPPTVPRSRRFPQETTRNSLSLLFPSLPSSTQQASHRRFLSDEVNLQRNLAQGTIVDEIPPAALNSSATICTIVRDPRTQTQTANESYERNEVDFLHGYKRSPSASDSGNEMDRDGMFDLGEPLDDALIRPSRNENEFQSHLRLISQQQLKDQLASVSAQILSTTNSVFHKFENLLGSFRELAASYQMLLENMEASKSVENSTCQASTSRNVPQEVPLVDDEREFTGTRSANLAGDQNRNDVMNGAPRRYPNPKSRLLLPPEYDPDDTRWTLKYYERMPGLVKLMPHSNIYVRYEDMSLFEQTSSSCPALAQKILLEVFNKKALSVCSSMTEKGQDSSIHPDERPKLDKHGYLVLLSYVLEHGHKRGWKIDMQLIQKALHDKIIEIRFTDGATSRC